MPVHFRLLRYCLLRLWILFRLLRFKNPVYSNDMLRCRLLRFLNFRLLRFRIPFTQISEFRLLRPRLLWFSDFQRGSEMSMQITK